MFVSLTMKTAALRQGRRPFVLPTNDTPTEIKTKPIFPIYVLQP